MTNIDIMRELAAYLSAKNKKVYLAYAPVISVNGTVYAMRSYSTYSISDAVEAINLHVGDIALYDASMHTTDDKNIPASKKTVYTIRYAVI